jgi:lipid-A-disaccharide synthase
VIFPFESAIYEGAGVPVTFVGHPLVDLMRPAPDRAAFLTGAGLDPQRPVLALLPGSRRTEVRYILPPLLRAVRLLAARRPALQFLLAVAPALDAAALRAEIGTLPVTVQEGQTHAVLGAATAAVVASGTATVEAALLGTPTVVVYRMSPLTYALGRRLVRVPFAAMPNLIAGREVLPELLQGDCTPDRIAEAALLVLEDQERRTRLQNGLIDVRQALGGPGASGRAADTILKYFFK